QSSVDYKILIGLGQRVVDSLQIIWPDQLVTRVIKPSLDTLLALSWPETGTLAVSTNAQQDKPLFESLSVPVFEKHSEDGFIDSYYDLNIPWMISQEGPKAAVGDVNGDGREDVYIGGATRQAGQLYLQTPTGFQKISTPDFDRFADFEDAAVLFFDSDRDGDLDLFVGSGGNNRNPGSRELHNRLYRNDGKGHFSYDSLALPPSNANNGVVATHDFDRDGDQDLFVGSRSLSLNYGPDPENFLLQNDGKGHFTDQTSLLAPGLRKVGLVTGAVWSQLAGDATKELIIVGEWMSPKVFSYQQGQFREITTNLAEHTGWWQALAVHDLDGDGDEDLILGNLGENFYLQPDKTHPVKVWMNDFDQNGSLEKIITQTINGKDRPVFLKRELSEQVIAIKKQNLKYESYGNKTIQELFPGQVLQSCQVKQVTYPSSCIAYNEGGGQFSVQPLPMDMQWSSLNAFLVMDVNGDKRPDLIAGGNRFNLLPQFCRLDASYGHVCINTGDRKWEELPSARSGILWTGQVRDLGILHRNAQPQLLVLQNDRIPVLYQSHFTTTSRKK
ncbi:MAG: FG-GAP-like repeat-containing protein, partial [Chitinophagaceae bacterium]